MIFDRALEVGRLESGASRESAQHRSGCALGQALAPIDDPVLFDDGVYRSCIDSEGPQMVELAGEAVGDRLVSPPAKLGEDWDDGIQMSARGRGVGE